MRRKCKKNIGLLYQELIKLLCNWKIYVCIIIYVSVAHMASKSAGDNVLNIGTAYTFITVINGYSNFNKLLVLVASLPFASSYYEDIQNGYINYIVSRSGTGVYIFTKVTVCAISSFLVSFAGLTMYSLLCCIISGHGVSVRWIPEGGKYYDVASGSMPWMIVFILCFLFSIVSCVYAVMGMTLSAFLPNKFVAVTGTLFMNILVEEVNKKLPEFINLFSIQLGNTAYGQDTKIIVIGSVMVVLGYIILSGLVFSRYVKRRISYESH
ncbi:MAG: hypothetical protein ACI4D4_03200 [Lachnospira sp.]